MKDLTIEEWDVLLCSTGYLPPRNEEELDSSTKCTMITNHV